MTAVAVFGTSTWGLPKPLFLMAAWAPFGFRLASDAVSALLEKRELIQSCMEHAQIDISELKKLYAQLYPACLDLFFSGNKTSCRKPDSSELTHLGSTAQPWRMIDERGPCKEIVAGSLATSS